MKSEPMAVYASGHLLFMRDQTLMAQPFDPRPIELSGEPCPSQSTWPSMARQPSALCSRHRRPERWSTRPARRRADGTFVVDRDGKRTGSIAQADRYLFPTLSPDGTRLAVKIFSGTQGIGDIWIFDLARGTSTRLTFGPSSHLNPVWTPDGKTIFYCLTAKGPPHIYAKAADGSGPERMVLESEDTVELPAELFTRWTLSGLRKAYGQDRDWHHLWVLPLFGDGKPFPIVQEHFDESSPAVSPDGKWMAYQRMSPAAGDLHHRFSRGRREVAGFNQRRNLGQMAQRRQGIVLPRSCRQHRRRRCECFRQRRPAWRSP